jgi:ribosomal protein L37E
MSTRAQTIGAIAMRKRRAKLKQQGLCTRCGVNNAIVGMSQCAECREYQKSRKRKRKPKEKIIIRELKRWEVANHRLYRNLMKAKLTIAELAEAAGVTARQVQRWIFEGAEPYPWNREKVEAILGKYWD